MVTDKLRFDRQKYGHLINYDRSSWFINGKRVFLFSGEFHYWRVPDRSRWSQLLAQYKSAGLNCVRIYFHWGYHSPREGRTIFSGNRDIRYLLRLCEKNGLYVLAAPGPYICAETSAGGIPLWLLMKKDIRIRHMKGHLTSRHDPVYQRCAEQWMIRFGKEIRQHQLTENPKGCVIGFQIENEYPEKAGAFKGDRKYMEGLLKTVRKSGITVPIFHNDLWPLGSWKDLTDLYAFDLYPVHAQRNKNRPISRAGWNRLFFRTATGPVVAGARRFTAQDRPLMIAELQDGWFDPWTSVLGYDGLSNFYSSSFQKLIAEACTASGATAMNFYMFYGGTNWGCLSNPEVYTSYDYSGCIREYGYLSIKAVRLSLFALFANSFVDQLSTSRTVVSPRFSCPQPGLLYGQRESDDGTYFVFLRNLSGAKRIIAALSSRKKRKNPFETRIPLKPLDSLIVFGNYYLGGIEIKFCSMPVIAKIVSKKSAFLVVIFNEGELILAGENWTCDGTSRITPSEGTTRIRFLSTGIFTLKGNEQGTLKALCIPEHDRLLNVSSGKKYGFLWGSCHHVDNRNVYLMDDSGLNKLFFQETADDFSKMKITTTRPVQKKTLLLPALGKWMKIRDPAFSNPGKHFSKPSPNFPENGPFKKGYLSGCVTYQCLFIPEKIKHMNITINARHSAMIWLNGSFIGKSLNYKPGISLFPRPGNTNGPDALGRGSQSFNLTPHMLPNIKNSLLILTDSYGLNKQSFPNNDCRNNRGIISASFSPQPEQIMWSMAGIDVRALENAYATCGLCGEKEEFHKGQGKNWTGTTNLKFHPDEGVMWHKTSFNLKRIPGFYQPLRLRLEGLFEAELFLNGMMIGRYKGILGPQHDFYLMDGFLKKNNLLVLACRTELPTDISASLLPWNIERDNGNLDETGKIFSLVNAGKILG